MWRLSSSIVVPVRNHCFVDPSGDFEVDLPQPPTLVRVPLEPSSPEVVSSGLNLKAVQHVGSWLVDFLFRHILLPHLLTDGLIVYDYNRTEIWPLQFYGCSVNDLD